MKQIIIIVLLTLFSNNVFSQSGWIQQNSGITTNLNSVKFTNSNTGWCLGDRGIILKTTNGGINWIQQPSGFNIDLKSVSFPSANTGFAVGDSGLILKTTNGGNVWIKINTSITNFLKSVFFVNENIGFTGGFLAGGISNEPANLYRTINSSVSWDSITFLEANYITSIQFLNPSLGWATMGNTYWPSESVNKTTNGGISWIFQYVSNSFPTRSVFFIDSLNGWLSSKSSVTYLTILRTTNSGDNWLTEFPGTGFRINSLYFTDKRNGWAAGENRIIQATTNGGVNWINQTNFQSGVNYRSIYFTDSLTGWVVGDSGIILKTTTGGVLTNFTNTSTEIPGNYFLSQNYPNPFNPVTNLEFGISKLGFVSLKVYDVLGSEIKTLVNENKPAGNYEIEFDAIHLSSGIYFYKIETTEFTDVKKMMIIK